MGPAAEERRGPGGETVRYYSSLPAGREIYAARFAPDGRLRWIEQRLTEGNVASLAPGRTTREEARELFGPPYSIDQYRRMMREVWTYPMRGTPGPKVLYPQFSAASVLREKYLFDDPNLTRVPGM